MRYGENPHQSAALYREAAPVVSALANWTQMQGKELSFNNIADADAAWECVKAFDAPACVIIKHANPCGVAMGAGPLEAYTQALKTDPTSAFGGIMAFNRTVDADVIDAINANKQFVEVVMAPEFTRRRSCRLCRQAERASAGSALDGRHPQPVQRAGLQARGRRHAAAVQRQHRPGR